jgi:hypothetical protein
MELSQSSIRPEKDKGPESGEAFRALVETCGSDGYDDV